MRRLFAIIVGTFVIFVAFDDRAGAGSVSSVHDLTLTSLDGQPLPLKTFRGKVLLVVNTASLCGFTYQYEGLQTLWETYRARGLVVLGVPSNDFGAQEPGSEAEIKQFCEVNFAIDFPMSEKQVVRGEAAHPLFRYFVERLGPDAAPRWNFHKYLVAPDGEVVASWPSRVDPTSSEITEAIEGVLPASS